MKTYSIYYKAERRQLWRIIQNDSDFACADTASRKK